MTETSTHPVTVTHARLRARQGDRRAAEQILLARLDLRPDDLEAQALLQEVRRGRVTPSIPVGDERLPERAPASPDQLAERFRRELGTTPADPRVRRLQSWLSRIARG